MSRISKILWSLNLILIISIVWIVYRNIPQEYDIYNLTEPTIFVEMMPTAKWQHVMDNTLTTTPRIQITATLDILRSVSRDINAVPYRSDIDTYGITDYWATPEEFYAAGQGDCEDFAIAKYYSLKHYGIPISSMSLAGVNIRDRDVAHVVLIVIIDDKEFVLDNITDRVYESKDVNNYELLFKMNEFGIRIPVRDL